MSSYYDRYMRDQARITALRIALAKSRQAAPTPGPMDIALDAISRAKYTGAPKPQPSTKPSHGSDGPPKTLMQKLFNVAAPITYWGEKANETSIGRGVMDVLSRGTYASSGWSEGFQHQQELAKEQASQRGHSDAGSEVLSWLRPYFSQEPYKEAFKGLTGEDKQTYSDVYSERTGDTGKSSAAYGLGLDIVGDPLNLIGGGTIAKAASAGSRAARVLKPVERAVEAAQKGEPVPAAQEQSVAKLIEQLKSQPKETISITHDLAAQPFRPKSIANTLRDGQLSSVTDSLKGQQAYAMPRDLEIPEPWKVEEVEEALPALDETGTPSGEKTPTQKKRLAQARAVKASILQDPEYLIQGKYRIGELLGKSAKEKPEIVEKLIDNEVKRIMKTGDVAAIPEKAIFKGRSGEPAVFGLQHEALAKLFETGEVGPEIATAYKATDAAEAAKFPVHSIDDLENVRMNTARGEVVTLGEYMRKLGIEPRAKGKIAMPKTEPFKFSSPKAIPATRKVVKEKQLQGAEMVRWMAQNQGALSLEDVKYLSAAPNRADYTKRLGEIMARTVAKDFGSVDELISAIDAGMIPNSDALLKKLGVKTTKQLKEKVDGLVSKVGPGPVDTGLKEGTPPQNPKLQRFKGPVPNEGFETGPKVTSAEEIAEQGIPMKSDLPALKPEQLQDLANALPFAVVKNLVDPKDLAKYPWITDIKKAKRTSKTPGEGLARNLHGWNKYSQLGIFQNVFKSAAKRHPIPKGLKGKAAVQAWGARSAALYDEVLPTLRAAEIVLDRAGVKVISGADNAGLMLKLTDVLESLPRPMVEKHLFNPRTSATPTAFIDAGDAVVRSLMGRVPLDTAKTAAFIAFKDSPFIKKLPLAQAERISGDLANAIVDNAETILQRVEMNYARHGEKVGEAVKSMTDEVIKNVITKYANPDISIGEAFGDFAMRADDISKRGRQVDAPTEAYTAARDATDTTLATVLRPGDFAEAKSAREMAGTKTEQEAAKAGAAQTASRNAEALDLVDNPVDLGDRYQTQLSANMFRANVPMLDKVYTMKDALGRAFVSDYGHANLHSALRVERSVTQDFARMHRGLIAQLHESIRQVAPAGQADAYTAEAFRHLQHGTEITDPAMAGIVRGLQSSTDLTFGHSVDNIGSFAQRNGIFPKHLNETLDYYKADHRFRFDENKSMAEQADAWKQWEDVESPLPLLDIMHAAMQRASVETTLGRDLSTQWGSKTQHPGFVKVSDKGNKSRLGRFIDKELYYPKEIVEQFKYLDDVLKGSVAGIKNPTTEQIIKKYDSIVHAWKSGMTIYRPGHHIRNLVGDITLSFFDGVTNPHYYNKSMRVLATRSKAYNGWDGLKALESGTPLSQVPDSGKAMVRLRGGKKKLNYDEVWRAAFDQGIIPDYRTIEDIAFNADQSVKFGIGKSLTRPFGGKVRKVAGDVSQARDHMVRIAHFMHALEHPKGAYKTAQEAYDAAGARVRKWHPDGSDLTNFENKVMRRTFMFYSWMRKAIPLVIETAVMQPGKAVIFPKAMYAFAEANGLDLDSLGNPFPVDQLFPEFITDQMTGPQFEFGQFGEGDLLGEPGRYGGTNPGEPLTEMISEWGTSNPQHSVGGALTPLARIPMELFNNKTMGTGSEIRDKSDYIDSQIPQMGALAKATGRSPSSGFTDPTSDVSRELVDPGLNSQALINFLTGMGIRDYSKPNYIKRAELEKRDRGRDG